MNVADKDRRMDAMADTGNPVLREPTRSLQVLLVANASVVVSSK
jgi:hypothetical protein